MTTEAMAAETMIDGTMIDENVVTDFFWEKALNPQARIAVIGECMLELSISDSLSKPHALSATVAYGGDTLNTAIYILDP